MITSAANAKVKNVIKLQKKSRERHRQNAFVVEGIRMFKEAPIHMISEIYLSKTLHEKGTLKKELRALTEEKASGLSIETVEDAVFTQMSDTQTPQGILCVMHMPDMDLGASLEGAGGTWILLEDIQDPGNLGTIIRCGEGAGVEGIILTGNTADLYNPKTIRATMGSVYRMPVFVTESIAQTVETMKEQGFAVYAAHLCANKDYDAISYEGKHAFLIGNEGNGLKEETAQLATEYIRIPMEGRVESLNAAIASSLLMYESYRHRRRRICDIEV